MIKKEKKKKFRKTNGHPIQTATEVKDTSLGSRNPLECHREVGFPYFYIAYAFTISHFLDLRYQDSQTTDWSCDSLFYTLIKLQGTLMTDMLT